MNKFDTIKFEVTNSIGVLTLNRPEFHNAMNQKCLAECNEILEAIEDDDAIRVLIIKGAGEKAFTAGADLREFAAYGPEEAREANEAWLGFFNAIESLPIPVIAQVRGHAPGGGTELSLCCDFVICSTDAKFRLAEINIGVIPGAGAGVRLTRWMGRLKAKEILMLGDVISGEDAVLFGLANECVSGDLLDGKVQELADKLTKKPPLALAAAKSVVNVASESPMEVALEQQLEEFLKLFSSEDQKEGMNAFLEKREANFKGR